MPTPRQRPRITFPYHGLPKPKGNLVGALGDSITVASSAATGGIQAQLSTGTVGGYLTWACILPKTGASAGDGKMRWSPVYATSGYTTIQILTTHLPQVLNPTPASPTSLPSQAKPDFCVVLAGANDAASGAGGPGVIQNNVYNPANFARWTEDYRKIVLALIANGIYPILPTLFPNNAADYGSGVGDYMNPWIKGFAASVGVPCPDFWAATHSGNSYAAGNYYDGTHPSVLGAKLAGQTLIDAVYDLLPMPAPTLNTPAIETNANILWLNGNMQRDGNSDGVPNGGKNGSAESQTAWTWTASNATPSVGARTGFSGQAWRMNKTGSGTTIAQFAGGTGQPSLTDYHLMRFGFVAEVASWNASAQIICEFYKTADSTIKPSRLNLHNDALNGVASIAPFVWSQDFQAASGFAACRANVTLDTIADFYLGQLTVMDLHV